MGIENPTPKKLTIGAQRVSSLKPEDQREVRKKQLELEDRRPKKLEHVSLAEQREEEQNLQFGEIVKIDELEGSSSKVFVIELENGDKAILKIINLDAEKYKTHRLELHAAQTERAAYLMSRILGFNFVPTTVIREKLDYEGTNPELQQIEDELGEDDRIVVQKFAKGKTAAQLELSSTEIPVELISALTIFDYIISNNDRNSDNYLISKKEITAVDNELSFGSEDFQLILNDLKAASSKSSSEFIRTIIQNYNDNRESKQKDIYLEFANLMPKEYIDASISRLEQIVELILEHGHIPPDKVAELTFN